MKVKIGCEFVYRSTSYTPMVILMRPRDKANHVLLTENRIVTPYIPVHEFQDSFGNNFWRFTAPPGDFSLFYDALAEVPTTPDPQLTQLQGQLVEELPDEVLPYLLPSRHCQSDLLIGEAWELFGNTNSGWERVQAVCNWLHDNVSYGGGSTSNTSGLEAFRERKAVCRDFAHMGVMLCRALSIPARYVCGYLPDINVVPDPTPMDFHAWFEVYLNGEWRTFDARHNFPRTGRVLIGVGRDAVDVALATSYGTSELLTIRVWADEVKENE